MDKVRVGVAIGSFQPITAPQFESVVVPAVEENDITVVILGSSFKPRTPRNPFDMGMREAMISATIKAYFNSSEVYFAGVRDYLYNNTQWLCDVQSAVSDVLKEIEIAPENAEITLYGAALRGDKSFYRSFPRWRTQVLPLEGGELADLRVRNFIYEEILRINDGDEHPFRTDTWREEVPGPAIDLIESWISSEVAGLIVDEDAYIKNYIAATQTGRYYNIHQTVDNVVIHKGLILLGIRGARPGKGSLALPGGFLKHDLTAVAGAMKELREETRLRPNTGWLVDSDRFDHPDRSERGRTITEAFLWQIPDHINLPTVKGSSDLKRAGWYELSDVKNNRIGELFEDHLDIIESMTARLKG
jgi:bifunctional NMN adenylyltransferase/nudix hydrolase